MATNKRDLRAYVRYDGTGRIIPGSLVLRRSKPKVGDWKEIQTYECCDSGGCNFPPVTLTYNISQVDFSQTLIFSLDCNLSNRLNNQLTPAGTLTPQQYVDVLNSLYEWTGIFSVSGDIVTYEINGNFANVACPDGELTFSIINPAIP